jgi:hypothetical protein
MVPGVALTFPVIEIVPSGFAYPQVLPHPVGSPVGGIASTVTITPGTKPRPLTVYVTQGPGLLLIMPTSIPGVALGEAAALTLGARVGIARPSRTARPRNSRLTKRCNMSISTLGRRFTRRGSSALAAPPAGAELPQPAFSTQTSGREAHVAVAFRKQKPRSLAETSASQPAPAPWCQGAVMVTVLLHRTPVKSAGFGVPSVAEKYNRKPEMTGVLMVVLIAPLDEAVV